MKHFMYFDTRYDLPETCVDDAIAHSCSVFAATAEEADAIYCRERGLAKVPPYMEREEDQQPHNPLLAFDSTSIKSVWDEAHECIQPARIQNQWEPSRRM